MWRLRKKFPFKSKGKGRGLLVSKESVQKWLDSGQKAGVRRGRPGRPPKKKVGRPVGRPKKKVGRPVGRPKKKVGRPVGRPKKKAATGRRPGRPPGRPPKKAAAAPKGGLTIRVQAGLGEIQQFVSSIKAGQEVQVVPDKNGFIVTVVS